MYPKLAHGAFRQRLVRMLLTTRWPREAVDEKKIALLSKKLGVRADVLREARDSSVQSPFKSEKPDLKTYPQLELVMCKEVWHAWRDWCESQYAEPNALLRGLVHFYLLGTWEPQWLAPQWRLKGKAYPLGDHKAYVKKHGAAWPYREKALVTPGAKRALTFRAERLHTGVSTLLRGLVLEVLEGGLRSVVPMNARAMWADVDRYTKHILG